MNPFCIITNCSEKTVIYFATQMLDLDFGISLTTLHTTYATTVLYAWLHLGPYSVQPLTDTAVRIEDNGIIQMEVLSLPARMGHFSSHLELTTDDWIFSGGLVSVMKVQMVSMSVKFLMRMEELRPSILGFTVDLSVSSTVCHICY